MKTEVHWQLGREKNPPASIRPTPERIGKLLTTGDNEALERFSEGVKGETSHMPYESIDRLADSMDKLVKDLRKIAESKKEL